MRAAFAASKQTGHRERLSAYLPAGPEWPLEVVRHEQRLPTAVRSL